MKKSLWARSPLWRWMFSLTVLCTAAALLASPFYPPPSGVQNARYTPPAVVSPPPLTPSGIRAITAPAVAAVPVQPVAPTKPAAPTLPVRDTAFDLPVQRPAETFPPGTELHLVGVYEGAPPKGEENKPWWANCKKKDGQIESPAECHEKYAIQKNPQKVVVEIRYQQPLVLALMSYNPVTWEINSSRPELIRKVILAGYHGQEVTGVGKDTPVDVYSHEASSCTNCRKRTGYFYTYKEDGSEYQNATSQLRNATGLEVQSFQGSYKGNFFAINPSTIRNQKKIQNQTAANRSEPVAGAWCRDHVIIANTLVSLPPGEWQVVDYVNLHSVDSNNALLSLAQREQDVLSALYAVRVETLNSAKGFARNLSCDGTSSYFNHSVANTPQGDQLCYWIEHLDAPWQQPFFELTASRLKSMGINIPADAINTGFHKADKNSAITTYLFSNPESIGIMTQPTTWATSPWHKDRIDKDPRRKAFMTEQQQRADTWFQFFRLVR
jgi:hypothetical protein